MLQLFTLLAQASTKSPGVSWFLVIFCVLLGLLVTLNPSRRTYEFKRSKDE